MINWRPDGMRAYDQACPLPSIQPDCDFTKIEAAVGVGHELDESSCIRASALMATERRSSSAALTTRCSCIVSRPVDKARMATMSPR